MPHSTRKRLFSLYMHCTALPLPVCLIEVCRMHLCHGAAGPVLPAASTTMTMPVQMPMLVLDSIDGPQCSHRGQQGL